MPKELSAREEADLVRRKLKHHNTEGEHTPLWMDTGEPELHRVLGSPKGIPYGRMIELSGNESQGKTLLAIQLAAVAQQEKAYVGWMPLEDPFDGDWAATCGLDPDKLGMFDSYIGKFGKEDEERLVYAEELFEEAETWMKNIHIKKPGAKIFLGIDSLAAIVTELEDDAGITGQNMRTNFSTPSFLSKLLRRWAARAKVYNAMIVMINQLRNKPNAFGNPEYTPGGKAVKFHCSVRAQMRRVGDQGKIRQNGKIIGIKGLLYNLKNKTGQGSIEGEVCGYKLYYNGGAKFVPEKEIRPPKKEK